jgi:hypothetical protein
MSAKVRAVKKKKIILEDDGIISEAIQDIVHDRPSQVHFDRAAEVCGGDRNSVPQCATIAELLAFVLSVKAAMGQDIAIKEFLDRFAPKAARAATQVDVNVGGQAAPVASQNSEEQRAAVSYMDELPGSKFSQ